MEEAKSEELSKFPEEQDQEMQGIFDTSFRVIARDLCMYCLSLLLLTKYS